MEKIGNITTKMIEPKTTAKPVENLYEAKKRWIVGAKRYLVKTEKNSYLHRSNVQFLLCCKTFA